MGKWMDLAAKLEAGKRGDDDRDVRDNSPPKVPIVPNVPASLPADIRFGLAALRVMAAPRITRPQVWLAIVADAVRLATDGWAAHALRLGWHPLELWGCSPERGGNMDHDSLAVWLDGRRVLLIDDSTCIVATGTVGRSVFNRRSVARGGVLLWDMI